VIRKALWNLKKKSFGFQRVGSALMLKTAFFYAKGNRIPGDFIEFGTLFGDLSIDAYYENKDFGNRCQLYFFDSFKGLPSTPEPYDQNLLEPGSFSFSLGKYKKRLKKFGVELNRVNIYEGFFSETLGDNVGPDKVAIAWVDCDLYSSTAQVLTYLTNRLTEGSLLIMDDYFLFESYDKGARLAMKEWLLENPKIKLASYRDFHWAGRAFIFNKE
jgi:O-methyltransferase